MAAKRNPPAQDPIILFKTPKAWATWLGKHHASSTGIWMQLAKKDAELRSITYAEALEVALCHGWIDGQKKSHDEDSWLQRFTPRGPRSVWSKVNREKVLLLIERGEMKPAGLKAVEAAQADGRWDAAYDSPKNAELPEEFRAALDNLPNARAFYETLSKQNRFAIIHRLQTARKPETRARRQQQFLEMLEKGEKLYP